MRRLIFCAFVTLLLPLRALADNCLGALIQDKTVINMRDTSWLAYMRLVEQSSEDKSSWSSSVMAPIDGIPAQFGLNSAEDATNYYFDHSTLNWSQERLYSVATQTLSKNAVDAYKTCIGAGAAGGTIVTVYDAEPDTVTVDIRWTAPPRAAATSSASISFVGGRAAHPFPSFWRSNEDYSEIIERAQAKDFVIVANIGGQADHELVAFLPPPPVWPDTPQPHLQLFVGLTPNVNDGEVSTNAGHKGGANTPFGWSIEDGPKAGAELFAGTVPYVNDGIINTVAGSWRGGATVPYGYVIASGKQSPSDHALYVGTDARCAGAVSRDSNFQNCQMTLLGYSLETKP